MSESDTAIREAVENLRKVMMEHGYDEGTANALTSAAMPDTPSVVGNLADLQRLGALIYEGATATEAVNEAVVINPAPGENPDVPAGTSAPLAPSPDLGAMTKSQLLDEADRRGVDADEGMLKAEIIAAIEAGG